MHIQTIPTTKNINEEKKTETTSIEICHETVEQLVVNNQQPNKASFKSMVEECGQQEADELYKLAKEQYIKNKNKK